MAGPIPQARFEQVLEPRQLRAVEGLRLSPRRSFPGLVRGERSTKKKGISIEFSDYREYVAGDDLRHLDWNVLARLGTPIVKTYRDEEDLPVYLLLDTSASMDFGEPSKFMEAKKWAAAFGLMGLAGGDAVRLEDLQKPSSRRGFWRGRAQYARLSMELSLSRPEGDRGLVAGIKSFVNSGRRPGLAIILSDGLDPDFPGALKSLGGRGHEVLLLQILSPTDVDPDLEGDLRLVDAESGDTVEVTANYDTLRGYRENLAAHNRALAEACLKSGGRSARILTTDTLESVVRDVLKREGWVE